MPIKNPNLSKEREYALACLSSIVKELGGLSAFSLPVWSSTFEDLFERVPVVTIRKIEESIVELMAAKEKAKKEDFK